MSTYNLCIYGELRKAFLRLSRNTCTHLNKLIEPHRQKNLASGFPSRSHTNRTVQPQKMAIYRGEFSDLGNRWVVLSSSEIQTLISLCGYRACVVTVQLICIFFTYAKTKFSYDTVQY